MITILPTDREFTDSPDAGEPTCLCSRCGEVIGADDVPVRSWPNPFPKEYRFHPHCVGLKSSDVDPQQFYDAPVEFKQSVAWRWAV